MKYGRLVVFIRNDSAEWFRYGLTLVIGTLKIVASIGVFVRVVCALKHSNISFPCSPSHRKMNPERYFYEGRQRTKQIERKLIIVVDYNKLHT